MARVRSFGRPCGTRSALPALAVASRGGVSIDGQAAYMKRLTNRKQREWLKKTQTGRTTLHGRYQSTEESRTMRWWRL